MKSPASQQRQACFGLYRSSLSACSFKECMFSIYIKVTCSLFLSFKPMHSKKKTQKDLKVDTIESYLKLFCLSLFLLASLLK